MNTRLIKTLSQVQELLHYAPDIEPGWESKDECYQWVEVTLRYFKYRALSRPDKGLIKRYLAVATGYSRSQITRLIHACQSKGTLKRKQRTINGFKSKYTKADTRLLAETDRLHNDLNGVAIKKLCERAFLRGDERYERLAGISRSQITRLIHACQSKGTLKRKQRTINGFKSKYTKADTRLLAETDRLHNDLNGVAIKKLCERAFLRGDERYERLAGISVSHLYNLRQSNTYRNIRTHKDCTRPVKRAIGTRRRPAPEGQPGFIRIDTVHQGDKDKVKGLYHINAVDEMTQFQIVCTVERISEAFLIPVLEEILAAFPFKLQGFHSDNGSEYINYSVAKLLDNLHIKFTKSRSRKTNDNALAECKNGAVIRKILGYAHIPQKYATEAGTRRRPAPEGQPGFIRIDTVHQGDKDKVKGLYHINAVDEMTQFQIVCTVERISEAFLIPVLEEILAAFPFKLQGFHSDNGSEYINYSVAKLLDNLHIKFTKSRSRKTNDNALAECKNGAVIRKILGYAHIPQKYATEVNEFNRKYLTPYLNYHRPCFFAETVVDKKGKERKKYLYENMMTPYEKFKSLPKSAKYLKKGITLEALQAKADSMSDNEAAERLQSARESLFKTIFERKA